MRVRQIEKMRNYALPMCHTVRTDSLFPMEEDVPQLILPGTDHNLQQLVSKEIAILL